MAQVTGGQDAQLTATAASDDPNYNSAVETVTVGVVDVDVAGLCFRSCAADVGDDGSLQLAAQPTEGGDPVELSVELATEPGVAVELRLDLSSGTAAEQLATAEPVAATVSTRGEGVALGVSAVLDSLTEGNVQYTVCVVAASEDLEYDGLRRCAKLTILDDARVDEDAALGDLTLSTEGERVLSTFSGFGLLVPDSLCTDSDTVSVRQWRSADIACGPDVADGEALLASGHDYYQLGLAGCDSSPDADGSGPFAASPVTILWPIPAGAVSGDLEDRLQLLWAPADCMQSPCDAGGCTWSLARGNRAVTDGVLRVQTDHFSMWALVSVPPSVGLASSDSRVLIYTEDEPPLLIDAAMSLEGSGQLSGARVALLSGYASDEGDELLLDGDSTALGVSADWDAASGVLSIAATDDAGLSVAGMEAVLRRLAFRTGAQAASDDGQARVVTLQLREPASVSEVYLWAAKLSVAGVPDPPVVNMGAAGNATAVEYETIALGASATEHTYHRVGRPHPPNDAPSSSDTPQTQLHAFRLHAFAVFSCTVILIIM